jgi:hypothetical protein
MKSLSLFHNNVGTGFMVLLHAHILAPSRVTSCLHPTYMHTQICVCTCEHVWIWVCVCVWACVNARGGVYTCGRVYMCGWVYICVHVHSLTPVFVFLSHLCSRPHSLLAPLIREVALHKAAGLSRLCKSSCRFTEWQVGDWQLLLMGRTDFPAVKPEPWPETGADVEGTPRGMPRTHSAVWWTLFCLSPPVSLNLQATVEVPLLCPRPGLWCAFLRDKMPDSHALRDHESDQDTGCYHKKSGHTPQGH